MFAKFSWVSEEFPKTLKKMILLCLHFNWFQLHCSALNAWARPRPKLEQPPKAGLGTGAKDALWRERWAPACHTRSCLQGTDNRIWHTVRAHQESTAIFLFSNYNILRLSVAQRKTLTRPNKCDSPQRTHPPNYPGSQHSIPVTTGNRREAQGFGQRSCECLRAP